MSHFGEATDKVKAALDAAQKAQSGGVQETAIPDGVFEEKKISGEPVPGYKGPFNHEDPFYYGPPMYRDYGVDC